MEEVAFENAETQTASGSKLPSEARARGDWDVVLEPGLYCSAKNMKKCRKRSVNNSGGLSSFYGRSEELGKKEHGEFECWRGLGGKVSKVSSDNLTLSSFIPIQQRTTVFPLYQIFGIFYVKKVLPDTAKIVTISQTRSKTHLRE